MRSTNINRLERWLGPGNVDFIAHHMRDWYGPHPIPVAGVPGEVYAIKGDFVGHCNAGEFASCFDMARDLGRKLYNRARITSNPELRNQLSVGFSTFTALRKAGLNGPRRNFSFACVTKGASQTVGAGGAITRWFDAAGSYPPAGSVPSAAPGGRNPTGGTNGGFALGAAPTGMNWYFTGGQVLPVGGAAAIGGMLLYDRLFDVAKTMNSTATEAVTGTISRYTSTTSTAADYAGGNFAFPEVSTTLANTAHNWNTCQYTNQAGTTGQSMPSLTGVAQGGAGILDMAVGQWFAPLAAGDLGIANLTQMQLSASLASGVAGWVIGHPIAWMPAPFNNIVCDVGGITSAFNMCRILDNACLSFIEPSRPSGQASYGGYFDVVAG